jgi:hypothetical protein
MNNSTTYSWQRAHGCAVLETNPAHMAGRIDAALRAIEQRVGSTVRIDNTENEAIESARNGLTVLRGEWFVLIGSYGRASAESAAKTESL